MRCSRRLASWQPIVLMVPSAPGDGWQCVAQLHEVYFLIGSITRPEDLLRANAEHADKAILLPRVCFWGAGLIRPSSCPVWDAQARGVAAGWAA